MFWKRAEFWLGMFLIVYLFLVGAGAAVGVIMSFPTETAEGPSFPTWIGVSAEQGLIVLAALAGIAGSFLHAAQSLSSYIGNRTFRASWTAWYFLRPWMGGALGLAIYFAFRAGLVAGTDGVNPYGVVALGLLGGWFSKTTTDKLQEVFETLFKTNEDRKRKDKLHMAGKPVLDAVVPTPVPGAQPDITMIGRNFMEGATVFVGGQEIETTFVSETELQVVLNQLVQRPTGGVQVPLRVRNPEGPESLSDPFTVAFN
jgi:hypothetical protein